jgi:hypothetical protein
LHARAGNPVRQCRVKRMISITNPGMGAKSISLGFLTPREADARVGLAYSYLPIGKMFMPLDFLRKTCSMSCQHPDFLVCEMRLISRSEIRPAGESWPGGHGLNRITQTFHTSIPRCFAQISISSPSTLNNIIFHLGRSQWERLIVVAVLCASGEVSGCSSLHRCDARCHHSSSCRVRW